MNITDEMIEAARLAYVNAEAWHNSYQKMSFALHAALSPGSAPQVRDGAFQHRVNDWIQACFGSEIGADKIERNHRFLEEALETVQSAGCTISEAHQLVDYVYGREVGDLTQEVGGVMNTLAALCSAHGLDMAQAGETELARVWTKIDKIRAKQAAKPKHSPLPSASLPPSGAQVTRDELSTLLREHGEFGTSATSERARSEVCADRILALFGRRA